MEHFKQFLAFPMFGAAIWMIWVLAQQVGASGVLYVLTSVTLIAFGFWLYSTTQNRARSTWQIIKKVLAALSFIAALYLIHAQPEQGTTTTAPTPSAEKVAFEPFSAARLAELRAANKPVFVNMTAAWCISCLANEKATLSTDAVKGFFATKGITYLKGDWTNYDDAITQYLKEFGRSGVPLYVFYPSDQTKAPIVLRQILTQSMVIDTLTPNL
jgi:thiol:disulfide interchange protein DsbD